MNLKLYWYSASLLLPFLSSCAFLHHVQIADIDNSPGTFYPFDVKVSETGIDVGEAAQLAKVISGSKFVGKAADTAKGIWDAITFGPRTGNVVFSDTYADPISQLLSDGCTKGEVTGLMVIRESTKYPVISGEIIRLKGFCLERNSSSQGKKS